MPLTNAFRDYVAQKVFDGTGVLFDNTNAFIGVGDTATAFAATQTDLAASTNKLRKGMDATFPQRAANVLTFKSTFVSAEANFAWAEWAIFNASTAGTMMSRLVQSLGTKTAGSTWVLTATITLNVA